VKHSWASRFLLWSLTFTGFSPYLLNNEADYILSQEAGCFRVCGKDQKAASIWIADGFGCPSDPSGSLDGVVRSSEQPQQLVLLEHLSLGYA